MKVEIGSGMNPQPDFIHLDIDKNFPHIEYECDISKDCLPFRNESVDEILANHVIEHIPWRKSSFVASEWGRVLKKDGFITIRTPNLRFICENYLKGRTTPEWPPDEEKMEDIFGRMGPSEWANVKLFSGQDYPSNFHFVCYDFEMISSLLKRNGFIRVESINIEPKFSPGELQIRGYK